MQYHMVITPFIISTVIACALGIWAWRGRQNSINRTFAWLMLAVMVWLICYVTAFSYTTIEEKIFWTKLKYLGATTAPVLWFILALKLTRRENWLTMPVKALLYSWSAITIFVVMTNQHHLLFWKQLVIIPGKIEASSTHGPYFMAYGIPVFIVMLICSALYLDFYRRTAKKFQARAIILAIAGLLPVLAYSILLTTGFTLLPQVDPVPLSFSASTILFAYVIFRQDAFEIIPIALDQVIKSLKAAIVVMDTKMRVMDINPFAMQFTNHPNPIGKDINSVYPLSETEIKDGLETEIEIQRADRSQWLFLSVSKVVEEETIGYVLVGQDITDRKLAEQALERQATTDPLTGARNRRAFFEIATIEVSRAKRQGSQLGLIMADIDHFKRVNDKYGHQIGDEVLVEVVNRCQSCLREIDIFARYGGEEFICLLSGNIEGITQTAERLRLTLSEKPVTVKGLSLDVTLSLGVAMLDIESESIDQLIERADKALYDSKRNGRDQVSLSEISNQEPS